MSNSEILLLNIQAQEEIKQQFQAEITKLEAQTKIVNKGSMSRFFLSQLRRFQTLNNEMELEIKELQEKISHLQSQQRQNLENQKHLENEISSIQKLRNPEFFEKLKNPSTVNDALAQIIKSLQSQTKELTETQADLEKRRTVLKEQLQSLINDQLTSRKEVASKEWQSELDSENRQNIINKRKRSNTISVPSRPRILPSYDPNLYSSKEIN